MKKILITILILSLLAYSVVAKDITVIFNFPKGTTEDVEQVISLSDDANSFHTFVTVANSNNLDLNMTYYSDFDSWFINGINGVNGNQDQYWHFWVNNQEAITGISAHVPENGDIIELGFADNPLGQQNTAAENAINWLVENQQPDGEIGSHKTWGNAFALMALNLFQGNETVKQNASDYLLSNQDEDAGFGYPGFDTDALHTSATVMGLVANKLNLEDFVKNGTTAIGFLLSKQESDGGFSGWGQSDVDTTSWTIMSFSAAGQAIPTKNGNTALDYIYSGQNTDGGFGYQAGQDSSEEYTAEALIAFAAVGQEENQAAKNGMDWLKGQQEQDGCFSNSYITALGTMALTAFEENNTQAKECLESMQLPDKGFGRDGQTSNAVDTALAIVALTGNTLPVEKLPAESNPDLVPIGSTAKFTIEITNQGKAFAKNVSIFLQGIPALWIQQNISETNIAEIRPNETKEAEIYVSMNEAGQKEIYAIVSAEGIQGETISNTLSFEIATADLDVKLSMQE